MRLHGYIARFAQSHRQDSRTVCCRHRIARRPTMGSPAVEERHSTLEEMLSTPLTPNIMRDYGVRMTTEDVEYLQTFETMFVRFLQHHPDLAPRGKRARHIEMLQKECSDLETSTQQMVDELEGQMDFFRQSEETLEAQFSVKSKEAMDRHALHQELLSNQIETVSAAQRIHAQTQPWKTFLKHLDGIIQAKQKGKDAKSRKSKPSYRALALTDRSHGSKPEIQLRAYRIDQALLTTQLRVLKKEMTRREKVLESQEIVVKFLTENNVWEILTGSSVVSDQSAADLASLDSLETKNTTNLSGAPTFDSAPQLKLNFDYKPRAAPQLKMNYNPNHKSSTANSILADDTEYEPYPPRRPAYEEGLERPKSPDVLIAEATSWMLNETANAVNNTTQWMVNEARGAMSPVVPDNVDWFINECTRNAMALTVGEGQQHGSQSAPVPQHGPMMKTVMTDNREAQRAAPVSAAHVPFVQPPHRTPEPQQLRGYDPVADPAPQGPYQVAQKRPMSQAYHETAPPPQHPYQHNMSQYDRTKSHHAAIQQPYHGMPQSEPYRQAPIPAYPHDARVSYNEPAYDPYSGAYQHPGRGHESRPYVPPPEYNYYVEQQVPDNYHGGVQYHDRRLESREAPNHGGKSLFQGESSIESEAFQRQTLTSKDTPGKPSRVRASARGTPDIQPPAGVLISDPSLEMSLIDAKNIVETMKQKKPSPPTKKSDEPPVDEIDQGKRSSQKERKRSERKTSSRRRGEKDGVERKEKSSSTRRERSRKSRSKSPSTEKRRIKSSSARIDALLASTGLASVQNSQKEGTDIQMEGAQVQTPPSEILGAAPEPSMNPDETKQEAPKPRRRSRTPSRRSATRTSSSRVRRTKEDSRSRRRSRSATPRERRHRSVSRHEERRRRRSRSRTRVRSKTPSERRRRHGSRTPSRDRARRESSSRRRAESSTRDVRVSKRVSTSRSPSGHRHRSEGRAESRTRRSRRVPE